MATPPTLVSYTASASFNTTGASKNTPATVAWSAGDVVATIGVADDSCTLGVPTATGLTFVSQVLNSAASSCAGRISAVVAATTGSATVLMSNSSSAIPWGFGCWVYSGSAGIGNSAEAHTSAATVSLTPSGVDGAIIYSAADFGANSVQTITPTPTNTRQNTTFAGNYTLYISDLGDQTSAGAVGYGIAVTVGAALSKMALEIKAAAGASTATGFGLLLAGQRNAMVASV